MSAHFIETVLSHLFAFLAGAWLMDKVWKTGMADLKRRGIVVLKK